VEHVRVTRAGNRNLSPGNDDLPDPVAWMASDAVVESLVRVARRAGRLTGRGLPGELDRVSAT